MAEGVLRRQEEMAMAESDRLEMLRRRDEARAAVAAEKKRAAEERLAATAEATRQQEAERTSRRRPGRRRVLRLRLFIEEKKTCFVKKNFIFWDRSKDNLNERRPQQRATRGEI